MQVNGKLRLIFPDSFTSSDLQGTATPFGKAEICMAESEKHILVSVGVKKVGLLTGLLVKSGDVSANMGKLLQKQMAAFDYKAAGKARRCVGGTDAEGVAYTYTAQNGTFMAGESLALKRGSEIYYFHFYTRWELLKENATLWEEILSRAEWTA